METLRKEIKLRCIFCKSEQFALPYENYRPHHGSFIVCANCGHENDFTSLIFIVKKEAIEIAETYANNVINEELKKIKNVFKGNKYIKFK